GLSIGAGDGDTIERRLPALGKTPRRSAPLCVEGTGARRAPAVGALHGWAGLPACFRAGVSIKRPRPGRASLCARQGLECRSAAARGGAMAGGLERLAQRAGNEGAHAPGVAETYPGLAGVDVYVDLPWAQRE